MEEEISPKRQKMDWITAFSTPIRWLFTLKKSTDDLGEHLSPLSSKTQNTNLSLVDPSSKQQNPMETKVNDVLDMKSMDSSPHFLFQNLPEEAPQIPNSFKFREHSPSIRSSTPSTPGFYNFQSKSGVNSTRSRTLSSISGSTHHNLIRKLTPLKLVRDRKNIQKKEEQLRIERRYNFGELFEVAAKHGYKSNSQDYNGLALYMQSVLENQSAEEKRNKLPDNICSLNINEREYRFKYV